MCKDGWEMEMFDDDGHDYEKDTMREELAALRKRCGAYEDTIKRLRNCVNCIHSEVCMTVHNRRVNKANDYRPCDKWMGGSKYD